MTRKDFILIAETIRDTVLAEHTRRVVAEQFAHSLKKTNPQFKPELFIQAATGECPLNARRVR